MHISLLVSSPTFLILTFHPKSFHAKNMFFFLHIFYASRTRFLRTFYLCFCIPSLFWSFESPVYFFDVYRTFYEDYYDSVCLFFFFSFFLSRDIPKSFYYYTNNDCPVFHIFDLKIVRILVVCFASGGGGPTHSKKGGQRGQEKITFIS